VSLRHLGVSSWASAHVLRDRLDRVQGFRDPNPANVNRASSEVQVSAVPVIAIGGSAIVMRTVRLHWFNRDCASA
jgi:hypothetical protein